MIPADDVLAFTNSQVKTLQDVGFTNAQAQGVFSVICALIGFVKKIEDSPPTDAEVEQLNALVARCQEKN